MRLRDVTSAPTFQRAAGFLAAEYLRLVWLTNRFTYDPPRFYERVDPHLPAIITFWHGQHFMVPFIRRGYPAKVLVSRHRDGEINAIAAARLGVGTIRGSGDTSGRFDLKGGVGAFQGMLATLQEGCSVALTADVPKVARVAGIGIVKLAQLSGRPILPVAVATSRRKVLDNWDRTAINLPFSRLAMVAGDPITVPADPDGATLEASRQALESHLNRVSARALALADGRPGEKTVG
jgi:lysophospholipid acyltransferase (LPLAT)-like uncharacterized protein